MCRILVDACAVQMYKALSVRCQRCTKKKQKKKITLRCMVIGTCAVQFLHYIPLYHNTLHYATLNCSVKRVCAPEAHKSILHRNLSDFDCINMSFRATLENRVRLRSLYKKIIEYDTMFQKQYVLY